MAPKLVKLFTKLDNNILKCAQNVENQPPPIDMEFDQVVHNNVRATQAVGVEQE